MGRFHEGMLLLTLLWGFGCAGSQAAVRRPSLLSLTGHLVYQHYDAPRRADDGAQIGGGLPLSIALDDEGNAWVLGEFHSELQLLSVSDSVLATRHIWIPQHPKARPFANRHGASSQTSMLGESVIVDGRGRVWLSEGGGYLVREGKNHSRVVSYDPRSGNFRAYNLPGNRNEAMGLLWDESRGLIWVAESGMFAARDEMPSDLSHDGAKAGALLAFDPETSPHDNEFLWDRPLDEMLCAEPSPNPEGCFARYELPDGALAPAQLADDASGAIWFTLFWDRAIGRLDPETGEVLVYPLAAGVATDPRAKIVGPGPWDIAVSPDGEYLVWSEFFDGTISRLPLARALDPACHSLRDGRNSCIEEMRIPGTELESRRLHSIAFDRFGNLWFTQFSFPVTPGAPNSIGFVTADWSRVELLDPTDVNPDGKASYAGIAIDHDTGDIWVSEFLPPGVGRLRPRKPEVDPATW